MWGVGFWGVQMDKWGGGGRVGEGGQGGCERRIKVFVKILKKISGGGGARVGGGGGVAGGQGGCERRIEVFVEMQKIGGGDAWSRRVWGVEGWGLVDREGAGWQQCWG